MKRYCFWYAQDLITKKYLIRIDKEIINSEVIDNMEIEINVWGDNIEDSIWFPSKEDLKIYFSIGYPIDDSIPIFKKKYITIDQASNNSYTLLYS